METLMAVLVVGLVLMSFYSIMDLNVAVTRVSRENLRATQILLNHMEGIRLFTWNQLTDTNLLPTTFTEVYNPSGTNGDQCITYTGKVSVATATLNPPAAYSTNIYQVTVQVDWTSGKVVRTRQMTTYCAKFGEQNYIIDN